MAVLNGAGKPRYIGMRLLPLVTITNLQKFMMNSCNCPMHQLYLYRHCLVLDETSVSTEDFHHVYC